VSRRRRKNAAQQALCKFPVSVFDPSRLKRCGVYTNRPLFLACLFHRWFRQSMLLSTPTYPYARTGGIRP
jgi:hypothetical protein